MTTKPNHRPIFILLLITLIAAFLRLYRLGSVPARLTMDELDQGYNAYSILKTGADEWGNPSPLMVIESFGDYKPPAYTYATVPFVSIFGLNPTSTRLASAISGLIAVFAIYFLAFEVTQNSTIGLLSSFMLAINPWPIHISRHALEPNLALSFFIIGLASLMAYFRTKRRSLAVIAAITLSVTYYCYVAYRLVVSLLLITIFAIHHLQTSRPKSFRSNFKNTIKPFFPFIITMAICLIPLAPFLLDSRGLARFNVVSLFKNVGLPSYVDESRSFCYLTGPGWLNQLCYFVYHKPQIFLTRAIKGYMGFLLPTFTFIDNPQAPYLSHPDYGEFLLIFAPFYVLGIFEFFKKKTNFSATIVKALFLLAPIPTALTGEPQVFRGVPMLVPISLITAIGIWAFYQRVKNTKLSSLYLSAIICLSLFSLTSFLISYFYIYPAKYDNAAYLLPTTVASYLKEVEANYDLIYLSRTAPDPHIFIAFYHQIDPAWYQQNVIRPNPDKYGFRHPSRLGKYAFGDDPLEKFLCTGQPEKTLIITDPSPPYPADRDFKNFSGVHIQARAYDLTATKLRLSKDLPTICQQYSKEND